MTAVGVLTLSNTAPSVLADDGGSELDLQGILPDFVPSGITESDFAELDGNWAEWANETGLLVIDFYSSDDPNIRGRRETLEQLHQRVATMERALEDPAYVSIHQPLADFHSRLAPRVAIMEALLETIELDVSSLATIHQQAALSRLATDAQALEAHLHGIIQGDAWLPYFQIPDLITAAQSSVVDDNLLALIADVQTKLAGRTALSDSQREFLSTEPFLTFEDSLTSVKASMVSQNPDDYRAQMRASASDLLIAIEDYEEEPLSQYTRAIRTTFDDIRRLAPDGADRLTLEMRRHYFNYNTRGLVDESLVQSLFNESRFESGFINDMVDNVSVTGCQWTNTHASIELKPSVDGVRFDLCLRGNIRASVRGQTHMATVFISGNHGFNGRKEVFFDGDHFHTRPARVSVYANNQPTGARTKFSPIPLFGRISENIAVNEARKKLPDANQRTRQQIYREAKPRFDREVDENFYDAELELERKVSGPLREQGLYADVKQFTSTDTDIMARTRLMEIGEIGGSQNFPIAVYPAHGILLQLHESLLNNAAERFDLEGKTFTPDDLKAYLKERFERLAGREVDLDKILPNEEDEQDDQPNVEEVVFAGEDAVRVQIEGGKIKLYLRIGLNLEGREPIPPQSISIELYPTLVGDMLHIEPGETIGVDAIGPVPPGERRDQIIRANVMRSKMQDLFEPQDLDSVFTFELEKRELTVRMTDVRLRGGWLSAVLTDGVIKGNSQHADASQPVRDARPPHSTPLPVEEPQYAPEATSEPVVLLDVLTGAF